MVQKSYPSGGILLLAIGLVSGCASANRANTALDDVGPDGAVEMIVLNRTSSTVTAFVQWRRGARLRLGEIKGGANRTFTTPYRGDEVWLSLDVLSSPPPATSPAPPVFTGGLPAGAGRNRRASSFVPVLPGDRIEWEIRLTIPSVSMFYRRLTPE